MYLRKTIGNPLILQPNTLSIWLFEHNPEQIKVQIPVPYLYLYWQTIMNAIDNRPLSAIPSQDPDQKKATAEGRILSPSDHAAEILEVIDEVYYSLDTEWRFTYLNPDAEQLWDRKREDLIGKHIWTEFPELISTPSYIVMHKAVDEQKPVQYETVSARLNLWVEVRIYPTPAGLIVNSRDISARKAAETELYASQAQLRQITDSLPMLVSEFDPQLHYRFVSKGYESIFGRPRDQMVGKHMVEIVGPAAFEKARPDIEAALRGQKIQYEREIPYTTGTRITRTQLIPHLVEDGTQIGVIGIVDDITELRRLENDQAQLAAVVTSSDDAIISKTLDGIITSWNPGAARLFGYSAEEVISKPITILFPLDRIEEETFILQQIVSGKTVQNYDTVRLRKDGSEVSISVSLSPIKDKQGRIVGVSKFAYDITARKQLEADLKRYARRMDILRVIDTGLIQGDSIPVLVEAVLKHVREIIPCQRASVSLVDDTKEAFLTFAVDADNLSVRGKGSRRPLIPDGFNVFNGELVRVFDDLRQVQETFPTAHQMIDAGLLSALTVLLTVQAQPVGFLTLTADTVGFFTVEHQEIAVQLGNRLATAIQQMRLSEALAQRAADLEASIIETKRVQMLQRQTEMRSHQILEAAQEGVWLTDANAQTTYVNQALMNMLGYTFDEMINTAPDSFVDISMQPAIAGSVESRRQGVSDQYDIQLHRKDGKIIWALVNATPLFDADGYKGSVAMISDISDRKRVELDIARKNRDLETLLYISSHDLREPLRAIRNFADIIQTRYGERMDAKGQDFLLRIVRAGTRMDRLIEDVLQLSRAQRKVAPAEHVSGEILVGDALKSLDGRVEATRAVITVLSPLPMLFVDRFWATQALFNLIANALKFTRPDTVPEVEIGPYLPPKDSLDGPGLVVRDRGIGLEAEHLERIFELFQRAVEREVEGTGAGLSIVREVAERHGGRAWAQQRPGGGTEFFITFGMKK